MKCRFFADALPRKTWVFNKMCNCSDASVLDAVVSDLHHMESDYLEKYARLVSKFPNTEVDQAKVKAKAALCSTLLQMIHTRLEAHKEKPAKTAWGRLRQRFVLF